MYLDHSVFEAHHPDSEPESDDDTEMPSDEDTVTETTDDTEPQDVGEERLDEADEGLYFDDYVHDVGLMSVNIGIIFLLVIVVHRHSLAFTSCSRLIQFELVHWIFTRSAT